MQVTDAAVGADGGQRLILRAAVKRVHLRAPVLGLDHTLAANRAGVAGVVVFEDRVGHRLARQRLGPRKGAAEAILHVGSPPTVLWNMNTLAVP